MQTGALCLVLLVMLSVVLPAIQAASLPDPDSDADAGQVAVAERSVEERGVSSR